MTTIVFLDCETTSLRPDRRAWEVGIILRRPGQEDDERSWFVDVDDLDLGNADPFSLRIGHFYERHPQVNFTEDGEFQVVDEEEMLAEIEAVTRDAHLVGAVPSFDAEVLAARMRAHGILPSWHYHLIDVEALALGWINGVTARAIDEARMRGDEPPKVDWSRGAPPWKSDDLSRAVGVEPPGEDERHTALGDAKWCARIWDAVTGVSARS